jgi:two-component system, chemotaxis family, CheB/CheR fusion protein
VETGGPMVTQPARKGFGMRLIERGLSLELDAQVQLAFETSGVVCTIKMPLPGGN